MCSMKKLGHRLQLCAALAAHVLQLKASRCKPLVMTFSADGGDRFLSLSENGISFFLVFEAGSIFFSSNWLHPSAVFHASLARMSAATCEDA